MSSPILQAIRQISEEKNIAEESVIETIEAALAAAYRKDFGEKNQNIKVKFDTEAPELAFDVFDVKTVVEDMELPEEDEEEEEQADDRRPAPREREWAKPAAEGEEGEEEEKKFNPKTEIMITAARETLKKDAEIGEEIRTQLEVPASFGRMAAQTAKQVIIQKIREAEREKLFNEFKDREHELVNATVQRREGRLVLIDLGRITAVMPPEEQIPSERYMSGDRLKVYVVAVRLTTKGPEVVVSRSHPDIIRKLFGLEIPEVQSGVVTIHAVAREAGARSKVAVSSSQDNVDPIGSCIGQRGTRIQTIIAEVGGEKIDVIQYDEDPATFIMNALSPAKVTEINLDQEHKVADVYVVEDQLSLAIGRGGQNVRLASKLSGWKINIRQVGASEEDQLAASADETGDGEAVADAEAGDGAADEEGAAAEEEGSSAEDGTDDAAAEEGAADEASDDDAEEQEAEQDDAEGDDSDEEEKSA